MTEVPAVAAASRRTPLALCISALFAVAAPGMSAASSWTVNDCGDGSSGNLANKTGTLRFAADHAASGDLVNLQALSCPMGKISLTTGSVALIQQALTIIGPGASLLQIDGSADHAGAAGDYRLFSHTGTGKLSIQNLGLAGGHSYQSVTAAKGGCVYSKGSVDLIGAEATACHAHSNSDHARGGAVYAAGDLKLSHSAVADSDAEGTASAYGGGVYTKGQLTLQSSALDGNTADSAGAARGGGAFVGGYLSARYSTVNANHAKGTTASARGGGLAVGGNISIGRSTISGNISQGNVGGLLATNESNYADNTISIVASTISGNSAAGIVGGFYSDAGRVVFSGATIAFNTADAGKSSGYFAPGVAIAAKSNGTALELESTIVSNNTYGVVESDLSVAVNAISVFAGNSVIRNAPGVTFFSTPITACPRLGPLRDNGGPTKTHALLSGSPAIEAGNTVDQDNFDQRSAASVNGSFDYFRVSGAIGNLDPQPDIGAYEVQQDDIVFDAGFDGCP